MFQSNSGLSKRGETTSPKGPNPCQTPSATGPIRFGLLFAVLLAIVIPPSRAAYVYWENCLDGPRQNNNTLLQWLPDSVSAKFNATAPNYNLNITVYGNVVGKATEGELPDEKDPEWENSNVTFGKIPDQDPKTGKQSTLFARFNVLGYTPYKGDPQRFCQSVVNRECPIAPDFNESHRFSQLPGFTVAHDMGSSYGFATINAVLRVVSNDDAATALACISTEITPYLGTNTSNLLKYMPLAVLVLVGVATASAAIFSPWGTWDIFRWTSNYGRDADQLRLITPGFGDCLQYIQFIVLSGSLSLKYPGFFQPAVSSVGWSALMFNQSFVNPSRSADGRQPVGIVDGVYATNSSRGPDSIRGLDAMSQLVGMANDRNIWAGMMIWLLVIVGALIVLIQSGFVGRWIYRQISNTQEEDLRAKNLPFTAGNTIRVIFNYFLLPLITFSMYQLVIAGQVVAEGSTIVTVIFAAFTLAALVFFFGWLFRVITKANPRSVLFDDLPTVLLYGPLYNTYSDHAAAFALVPLMLTILRGIAIGAVQSSGVAQLILLAICEVILILTLNAFRPFSSPTSMNAYHTIFSVVRLLTILLMVAFIPSLGADQSPRGWIGYIILLMHGITLFVGFFLHSLQTLVEVIARLAGAGGEDGTATRGGLVKVFGVRQLSRRSPRNLPRPRNSMASDAAMLNTSEEQKRVEGLRSRSISASSAQLLNAHRASGGPESSAGGEHSHSGSASISYAPTMAAGAAGSSSAGARPRSTSGGIANLVRTEPVDPFFRQPRPRGVTMDLQSPGGRSRGSWTSGDWTKINSPELDDSPDMEGPSVSGRATPQPAYLGGYRDRADSNPEDTNRPKTDYAIREVDYYYGVRGPALSHMPTRRLKTGPADPTGPVSSATGWFKNFFGSKTKEKGKGFEVVRSSRMPPSGQTPENGEIALEDQEPYRDDPEAAGIPKTTLRPRNLELDDEGDAVGGGTRRLPSDRPSPMSSDDEDNEGGGGRVSDDEHRPRRSTLSPEAPILPVIETGGSIHLPSRDPSKASVHPYTGDRGNRDNERLNFDIAEVPAVPRKSSKRASSSGSRAGSDFDKKHRLSVIPPSPSTPQRSSPAPDWPLGPSTTAQRLPFTGLDPNSSRAHNRSASGGSMVSALSAMSSNSEDNRGHARHSSSALGTYAPSFRDDRPSSVGYVQQHRASDHIHVVGPQEQVSCSRAELVYASSSRTPSPDNR